MTLIPISLNTPLLLKSQEISISDENLSPNSPRIIQSEKTALLVGEMIAVSISPFDEKISLINHVVKNYISRFEILMADYHFDFMGLKKINDIASISNIIKVSVSQDMRNIENARMDLAALIYSQKRDVRFPRTVPIPFISDTLITLKNKTESESLIELLNGISVSLENMSDYMSRLSDYTIPTLFDKKYERIKADIDDCILRFQLKISDIIFDVKYLKSIGNTKGIYNILKSQITPLMKVIELLRMDVGVLNLQNKNAVFPKIVSFDFNLNPLDKNDESLKETHITLTCKEEAAKFYELVDEFAFILDETTFKLRQISGEH